MRTKRLSDSRLGMRECGIGELDAVFCFADLELDLSLIKKRQLRAFDDGIADLSDNRPRLAGLAEEGEDIRAHVLSFDHLMALVKSGEVATAPLLMTAYWLEHRRATLRAAALAQPPAP